MNNCPDCGYVVKYQRTEDDVATTHTYYICPRCTAEWEVTVMKDNDEVLYISPVKGGD